MNEIKPCPFCGGEADLITVPYSRYPDKKTWSVVCRSCGARGSRVVEHINKWDGEKFVSKSEVETIIDAWSAAIEAWNRRVE
jgi:hypothetical protein